MKFYFKLLRPHHWIKNLILFLPIILTTNFIISIYIKLIYGFISFSLLSSGGYILNDIKDIENDRQHLKKKNRPLAAGIISKNKAYIIALISLSISILFSLIINQNNLYYIL